MASVTNSPPVIFGEVLFDKFPDGNAVLGGAPFNVAWHLQGLGLNPFMISAVGDDEDGQRVLEAMRSWGMNDAGVQILKDYPTGQVSVSLHDGQPSYEICENQAYDNLGEETLFANLGDNNVPLLYHGSLMARTPHSRLLLEKLITISKAPVFVDVNLRPPWWKQDIVESQLSGARWVKLNEDELITILKVKADSTTGLYEHARELLDKYNLELVIVTQGEHGAFCISRDDMISGAPVEAKVIDTVGAGDSFSAVMIMGLLRDWPLATVLERALEFAARICGQRGATSSDSSLYQKFLADWGEG